jgi:rubrerythrin
MIVEHLFQAIAISQKDFYRRRMKVNLMSNTEKFLKEAFAGESQANRKYSAFAAKADKEGFA